MIDVMNRVLIESGSVFVVRSNRGREIVSDLIISTPLNLDPRHLLIPILWLIHTLGQAIYIVYNH